MTLIRTIAALAAAWLPAMLPALARAQTTQPTASLITFGPGVELYEQFGHNALRIEDPALRPPYNDLAYNYGLFTFGDNVLTDFLAGFVQGSLLYWVAPESTPEMLAVYQQADRTTSLQELNLTPQQSQQLADFLWWNADPANRAYVYAPYTDNCSTRVRDAIDRAFGGQLKAQTQDIVPGHTFRFHTRRIMATNPPVFIALEFILGQNADKPLTRWDEMFLPGLMEKHLRNVTFTRDDGQKVPAIRTEQVLYRSTRPDLPDAPPNALPYFTAAGFIMAGGLLALSRWPHRRAARLTVNLTIAAWTLLAAFAGCIATYMTLFTRHQETYRNENLLQMPPLALFMLVLLPWALRRQTGQPRLLRALRITQYIAAAIATCSVLGLALKLLPWFTQQNWNIIAWVLPVNVAIAIILWQRAPVAQEQPDGRGKQGAMR